MPTVIEGVSQKNAAKIVEKPLKKRRRNRRRNAPRRRNNARNEGANRVPNKERKFIKKEVKKVERKELKSSAQGFHVDTACQRAGFKGAMEISEGINRNLDSKAKQYMMCQANPALFECRIPDAYARKTALYHSRKVFEIQTGGTLPPGDTQGLFAFLVQPKLGNIGDPVKYQVAVCKPSELGKVNQSGIDWTSVNPYLDDTANVSQYDLRLDPNLSTLTQQQIGYYRMQTIAGTGQTQTKPFGTAGFTFSALNKDLNITYDSSSTNGTFIFPPGSYQVDVLLGGTGVTDMGTTGNVTSAIQYTQVGNTAQTQMMESYTVVATRTHNQFSISSTATTITGAWISVSTAVFDGSALNEDDGAVENIRPVAMSVLASYNGPLLTNGGQIAMARIPSDAAKTNFFTNSPDNPGSFRTWNVIANLNQHEYDGPLNKGAYGFWSQEDVADYDLRTPSDMNSYQYPSIVCAGQWNPGDFPTSDAVILRVEIDTIFEYTTIRTIFDTESYIGSSMCVEAAQGMMASQNACRENPGHIPWYKKLLSFLAKTGKIVGEVAPIVMSAL